jgi:Gas vesicle protein G
VGLVTKLLTLPLAPVRGVVWLSERIAEAADRELGDEDTIRRRLHELQMAHDMGEVGDREFELREEQLLAQLADLRTPARRDSDG